MSRSKTRRGRSKKPRSPARESEATRPARPRGLLYALAALVVAAVLALAWWRQDGADRWNVVIISIDTLRPDELSAYGGPVPAPNIGRLARDGVVFENAHTVAPLTLPAHASLFTARWPYSHGVRDNVGFYLEDGSMTLARHLRSQGYRTGGFVSAFVLDSRFGIHQGFERYFDEFDALEDDVAGGFVSQRPGADTVDRATAWMEEAAFNETPFFAFIHLFEPHTPYTPPDRLRAGSGDRALYRGEVALADELVGKVLDWLESRGLADRTLVALVSDHGESLGEHGEKTHGLFVYESTLRIPFVLRYPDAPSGTRVSAWTRIVDVAPTLVDLAGLPPLPGAEGRSVADVIRRPEELGEAESYAESFLPRLHYGWSALHSLRRGNLKLILAPSPELYDLDSDPDETDNLFLESAERARPLLRELTPIAEAGDGQAAAPVDSATAERLRSLGYLGGGAEPGQPRSAGERADPKDRLDVYHLLNDPTLRSLAPGDGPAFAEAVARLERVVADEPGIPRARILLGELLLAAGRADRAVAVFRDLVGVEESFDALYGLGVALQAAGKLPDAATALTRAQEVEPRNAKSYARLAEIAEDQGELDEAERWLLAAIERSPDRVLRSRLAALYLGRGESAKARAVLDDIVRDHGGDPVALYNLGQTLLIEGDARAALDLFEVAVELDPDDADIRHGIANSLIASGDAEASLEAYDAAIALSPCFAAAHGNRGLALAQLGRQDDARSAFREAIRCAPDYVPAYRNLAAVQLQSRDLDAAIETLERAAEQVPGDRELAGQLEELRAFRGGGQR